MPAAFVMLSLLAQTWAIGQPTDSEMLAALRPLPVAPGVERWRE